MRRVVVFDTNVLFSSIGWKGKPFQCVELARAGVIAGITCQEIHDELADKLQTKLSFSNEQIVDTLADLLSFLQVVSVTGQLKFVAADADDDKIIECALVARATHIVTGDRKHLLPLGTIQGIAIVTSAELLELVQTP